ncbi:MAG: hypothetical protein Q8O91_04185 [Candidatus Aminicenantes bacterium]|nr:hypothetical protein [Candidatus Aminicenantes bacterium]
MLAAPELVKGVEFMTKPAGTVAATVPRGYLVPAELDYVAEKLRTHNVKVKVLAKPIKAAGEEFVILRIGQGRGGGYNMIKLEGGFAKSPLKEFPAGTFRVDLAQPMANVAFYCLKPRMALSAGAYWTRTLSRSGQTSGAWRIRSISILK